MSLIKRTRQNLDSQKPGQGSKRVRKTNTGKMVPKSKAHQPSTKPNPATAGPRQKAPNTPMKKTTEKAKAAKGKSYSRRGQVMATAPRVFRQKDNGLGSY